jgi:hypothetical protein
VIRLSERFAEGCPRARPAALAIVTAVLASLAAASVSMAASPTDTAATHAFLQARYDFYVAALRDAPAARAGFIAASQRLARECPGVLAHAPRNELEGESGESRPSPRARGERERAERQRATIEGEIGASLSAAESLAYRPAAEAFITATSSLSWSDASIAPLVQASLTVLREAFATPPPDACADMKAWAASGYRSLSPASRAFRETQAASTERLDTEQSISAALKPYEGSAERALLARTQALLKKFLHAAAGGFGRVYVRLQRALGAAGSSPDEPRRASALAHGTTRSGATFTIRRSGTHEAADAGCRRAVSVETTEKPAKGSGSSFSNSSTTSVCFSPIRTRDVAVECAEGEVSIIIAVPASVRAVRLRLSDGSTITSPVARISRKDGGPAGIYVQALRGDKRRPVSLTELDAGSRAVKVVRVRAPRCKREPRPIGPKFFELVHGTAPGGTPFTIEGSLVDFPGHGYSFGVSAQAGIEASEGQEASLAFGPLGGLPKPSPWHSLVACPPRAFALVYGLLVSPGDSVLARTPEGLVPLAKQQLDPSMHAEGPLVYGVFSSLPSELIVRRSDGSTLSSESLVAKAKEDAEFCEGLAEN